MSIFDGLLLLLRFSLRSLIGLLRRCHLLGGIPVGILEIDSGVEVSGDTLHAIFCPDIVLESIK